jgi:hypothetical protein
VPRASRDGAGYSAATSVACCKERVAPELGIQARVFDESDLRPLDRACDDLRGRPLLTDNCVCATSDRYPRDDFDEGPRATTTHMSGLRISQ